MNVAWQIESSRLDGAEVVGTFRDGSAAITTNSYGEGTGVLVSSYPSLAYNSSADPDTASSVVALLDGGNVISRSAWMTPMPGLVSRRASSADGRQLVFAINWGNEPAHLAKVEGGELLASTSVGGSITDRVPAKSAVLLTVPG
jgi:hypothetical protein